MSLTIKGQYRLNNLIRGALIIGICLVVVFPIYWMLLTAIQPLSVTLNFPPPLVPVKLDFSGLTSVIQDVPIVRWLGNSTVVAGFTTILSTTFATLGAFALSAMKWRGKLVFAFGLLLTQLMPTAAIIVPIFDLYKDFGLLGNLLAVGMLHAAFTVPICIWILKESFDRIPREVLEAGYVDGCGHLGVLRRIVLPISIPAVIAVGVIAFFTSWSEFLFASTMISDSSLYPASVGLSSLISQLDTPVATLLSGGLLYALPPVILYMIVQKYIIAGMTAGAVKG